MRMQAAAAANATAEVKDPAKFVGKKSKAAAKKGPGATQWGILKLSGIPEDEIPKFRWVWGKLGMVGQVDIVCCGSRLNMFSHVAAAWCWWF